MTDALIDVEGRVLAAIDRSAYSASVADHAGWAASRLGAPLELLHAIDRPPVAPATDLSGNIGLDSREALLSDLTALDEQRGRLAQQHGRQLLEDARARIATAGGVEVSARQRHGSLVDTLLELEAGVRLFVIGKRGEHADFARGHLGSNLERVVRSVHRPVLVASRSFRPVGRFLIAFDGSPTTRKCVEMVAASPLLAGLACELLVVGQPSPANDAIAAWAQERLRAAGFEPVVLVVPGAPEDVIAQTVAAHASDLLVMGAYGHSRIRSMILGSTTTQVLRSCLVPVLLLR